MDEKDKEIEELKKLVKSLTHTPEDGICDTCGDEASFEKICSACEQFEGSCNCEPIQSKSTVSTGKILGDENEM